MTPMTTRHFPVLLTPAEWKRYPDCPRSIPWHLVALHEPQAWQNHRQSLATLARRGGLDPTEMRAVLEGKRHGPPADRDAEMAAAVEYLKDLISQPERPHPMQPHDLDQLSRDIAHHIHGQAPQGAAASTVAPDQLAAQIRPHLTPEVVELLGGDAAAGLFGGGGGGAGKKPFNFGAFIDNLNKILPLITTLIGAFGGPKIPPITIPTPTSPTPTPTPAPAGP
jgi:hypothetical protein